MAAPGGTGWLSVPAAARRLGISERAVRKRITAGTLPAERDGGGPWRVQVGAPFGPAPAVPDGATGGTAGGIGAVPIEAPYRTSAVVPTVSPQLAAIRDEWLAPLVARIATLEREHGRLEAERDAARQQVAVLRTALARQKPAEVARAGPRDAEGPETTSTSLSRWQRLWLALRG